MSKKRRKRLLRIAQVLEVFPVSKSTWWAGVKSGKYPQPCKLGCRCTAWHESDIDQLIEQVSGEAQA